MEKGKSLQIAVIGGSEVDPESIALALEVGRIIAEKGAVLICGGLGGVMEASARGAKEKGGLTIGLLPSYDKASANPFVDVALPTGLGHARNILVAASGDLVIALPGSHGTRSEIAIAMILGKPVLGIRAWGEIPGVHQLNDLKELHTALLPYF